MVLTSSVEITLEIPSPWTVQLRLSHTPMLKRELPINSPMDTILSEEIISVKKSLWTVQLKLNHTHMLKDNLTHSFKRDLATNSLMDTTSSVEITSVRRLLWTAQLKLKVIHSLKDSIERNLLMEKTSLVETLSVILSPWMALPDKNNTTMPKDNTKTDLLRVMVIANNSENPSRPTDWRSKTLTLMFKRNLPTDLLMDMTLLAETTLVKKSQWTAQLKLRAIHSPKDNIETDLLKAMEIVNNSENPSRPTD